MGKNGGAREGAGRKRIVDYDDIRSLFDDNVDREYVVRKLIEKIDVGDIKAITLYFNYVYGKPKENVKSEISMDVNNIDISKLINFKK